MDAHRLALRAYYSTLESAHELQRRIVMRKLLVDEFGADALAVDRMLLSKMSLKNAVETNARQDKSDREQLADLLNTIREMEKALGARDEADMDALAEQMAETLRAEKAKNRKTRRR